MKVIPIQFIFLSTLVFSGIFFGSSTASADCNLSADIKVTPAIRQVPREEGKQSEPRKITVTWNAPKEGCFEGVQVSIGNQVFENQALSGSKTIEMPPIKFEDQFKKECAGGHETPVPVYGTVGIGTVIDEYGQSVQVTTGAHCRVYPDRDQGEISQWKGKPFKSKEEGEALPDGKIEKVVFPGCPDYGGFTWSKGDKESLEALTARYNEKCKPDETKYGPAYWFSGIKQPFYQGYLRKAVESNVDGVISFSVIEGGGTSATGKVLVCDVFENDPLSWCDQKDGPAGKVIKEEIMRPFGPSAWLRKYPLPEDMKDVQIKIDPEYVKIVKENAKYTPIYTGSKKEGGASALDTFRVSVKANSFRSPILYNAKLKLVIAKEGEEVDLTDPLPLHLVWKNGAQMPENQSMTAEIDQWFKAQSSEYTFESEPINLNGHSDVIDAVSNNQPIFFRLLREDTNEEISNETKLTDKNLVLTNCARQYGEGKHKIIFIPGSSSKLGAAGIVSKAASFRTQGFEVYEPYKDNKDLFSYFVDLQTFNDDPIFVILSGILSREIIDKKWPMIQRGSSCSNGKLYSLIIDSPVQSDPVNGDVVVYGLSDYHGHFFIDKEVGPNYFVHESGHSLGKMLDVKPLVQKLKTALPPKTNCTTDIKTFTYNGINYAEKATPGCSTWVDKNDNKLFRSSEASIMNYDGMLAGSGFDIIECGGVMASLKGGKPESHYAGCKQLLSGT